MLYRISINFYAVSNIIKVVICGLLGNYTALCGNYYHTTPCNYPKDHRLHQHRGGSLKSRIIKVLFYITAITFWGYFVFIQKLLLLYNSMFCSLRDVIAFNYSFLQASRLNKKIISWKCIRGPTVSACNLAELLVPCLQLNTCFKFSFTCAVLCLEGSYYRMLVPVSTL
jgi:hypothetical protein